MTYKFNKQQHSTKIKEGLERAKKNGKKLGRPSGKIKGEDDVIYYYEGCLQARIDLKLNFKIRYQLIAEAASVSLSTVKRIIKKHKATQSHSLGSQQLQ
jgi:DNA invertase Pin-like site-specific DNA recombinase